MSTISPNAVDETGENNTVLRRRLIFYDTILSGRSNKDMLIIIITICTPNISHHLCSINHKT